MGPQLLDVAKFQKLCDPIIGNPWNLSVPITKKDINRAVATKNLVAPTIEDIGYDHVARIAWFVVHGWDDPIGIDVGIPSLGCNPSWPLEDGNHRFAAAVIRRDLTILAEISGAVDIIEDLLYKGKMGEKSWKRG